VGRIEPEILHVWLWIEPVVGNLFQINHETFEILIIFVMVSYILVMFSTMFSMFGKFSAVCFACRVSFWVLSP